MPKDIYRLEGSALDVLFNYLEQDKPVPHVISKRALSQWKQYLASEGAMSLEESFFGSETPSFAETKARYKSDRELYMKLLNAEAAGKERSDLHEMLSGGLGKTAIGMSDRRSVGGLRCWKKEINAGRVLRKTFLLDPRSADMNPLCWHAKWVSPSAERLDSREREEIRKIIGRGNVNRTNPVARFCCGAGKFHPGPRIPIGGVAIH